MSDRTFLSRRLLKGLVATLLLLNPHLLVVSSELGELFKDIEANTDRWIELQSRTAKTKSGWKSEAALLEGTIKLLETEQATLLRNLESNKNASERYTANRNRIANALAEQKDGVAALESPLREIERSVRQLYPRLPEPLQRQLDGHLAKMRPSEEGASVSTRAQALVAMLTAIDRFGNSITLARQTRPGLNADEVSVRVLYWGLAGGYGIDPANGRAWVLEPSTSGWNWAEQPEAYERVATLIHGYENQAGEPQLVLMPAALN